MTNSNPLSNFPDIELALQSGQCWCATYMRNAKYKGFGATPTEAIGHLMITHPVLFGFRQVRFANDAATQTYTQSMGLDNVISSNNLY